jgi:predicted ArsR family transcriptional regulator
MTYSWEFTNSSAGRVLKVIQVRGRASIKEVAADLGVTASAVRLHLTQLQASGAVRADKVREGVGRPYYVYSVTPQAHNLFYKDYGDLARLLLQELGETQGADGLQSVLRHVADKLAELYRNQVGSRELTDRIAAWADLLDQRGVMERQVMARLLESGVKLTQCVLDGYRGCQFAIAGTA